MTDHPAACERCGAFGNTGHGWTEGDCVLPEHDYRAAHPPAATIGRACRGCVDRVVSWLTEIVEMWATLGDVIPAGSVPDDTAEHKRPKKAAGSPALMRLDAWSMLRDRDRLIRLRRDGSDLPNVPDVLVTLAGRLIVALRWTQAAPDTVSGAAALLTAHVDVLVAVPWLDEAHADLKWVRKALMRAHGRHELRPLGRCITVTDQGECNGLVWPTRDGDNRPRCSRCRRRYGTLDIVRLQAMQEHDRESEA